MKTFATGVICIFFLLSAAEAQDRRETDDPPRLVVGIVVDQIRADYLERYRERFGEDGFRRMMREGFRFTNTHFNYFPTYTGPGHAAVYTGTTPAINGIVGNSWYDRTLGRSVYVVEDPNVQPVGSDRTAGRMSPANLLSTTVTDELKSSDAHSKVIGISLKDRGAVIPAGHAGDGAYWYDGGTGQFLSSSWYVEELPEWVRRFNESDRARAFSDTTWKPLYDLSTYTRSNPDDSPYEGTLGSGQPVFPHEMDGSLSRIQSSPFGNTLVNELAKEAVSAENLGADEHTDFLAVSFSATDYVGHTFGPRSVELEDTYLRLDRDLAGLFRFLDKQVGEGNWLVFLTSDHGVVDVPSELTDRGLPGGYFNGDSAMAGLRAHLSDHFGGGEWISAAANQQIYLDRKRVEEEGLSLREMQKSAARYLMRFEGVLSTNTAENFRELEYAAGLQAMFDRGFDYRRSGDIFIQLRPGWLWSDSRTGTTHGSPWNYDTHVPLIFMGTGIPHGQSHRRTVIPQIAPTLSILLGIPLPSGSEAEILEFSGE